MYKTIEEAHDALVDRQYKEWALVHHAERVSGIPHNPPPSHKIWQGASESMSKRDATKFSHSYPERFWEDQSLGKLIDLLVKEPDTRQAYLPMYLQKDLDDSLAGERVPCSLGWHFIIRNNRLHVMYPMRSLDVAKHLGNDLFFINALTLFIIQRLQSRRLKQFLFLKPGELNFQVTSAHYFKQHEYTVRKLCS